MQHGTAMQRRAGDGWGGQRPAIGPVALLFGVLAVFVLVHVGTMHDLALTDLSASRSHEHVGALGHGDDRVAPAAPAAASAGVVPAPASPEGGHHESGHDGGLVGCLVALTGLVGGLMLVRPRLLPALAAAGGGRDRRVVAVVASRALGTRPAPTPATLCVLRT